TNTIIAKVAELVAEEVEEISTSLQVVVPALVAALVTKGNDRSGAKELLELITTNEYDGTIFQQLPTLLSDKGTANNLINHGKVIIYFLLGERQSFVLNLITNATPLSRNSSSYLMHLVAPLAIEMLGKQLSEENPSTTELMKLLNAQRDDLQEALATGFGSALGLGADRPRKTTDSYPTYGQSASISTEKRSFGWLKVAIPILLLLVLGGILLFVQTACTNQLGESPLSMLEYVEYNSHYILES
ncbi:MAG: DUF937 domain-containing protein, partial [Bacteroidota bacterium]